MEYDLYGKHISEKLIRKMKDLGKKKKIEKNNNESGKQKNGVLKTTKR